MRATEWLEQLRDEKSKQVIQNIIKDAQELYRCENPIINLHNNGSQDVLVIEI